MDSEDIITLSIGLGGLIFGAFQAWMGYIERKHTKRDDFLFEAFKWFEGGSQKRNIGISIVEGFWEEVPHLRGILVPLLTNQAIYLLTKSEEREALHETDKKEMKKLQEEREALHEEDNLNRIMKILLNFTDLKGRFDDQYKKLTEVIEKRLNNENKYRIKVDVKLLKEWKEKANSMRT